MKHKYKVLLLFFLTLLLTGIGYVLTDPAGFGICEENALFSCISPIYQIGAPTLFVAGALSIALLLLIFLPKKVFSVWLKYFTWITPILLLWIILTPPQCRDALGLCFYRELASQTSAGVILIISLFIILIKSIQLHRQKTPARP